MIVIGQATVVGNKVNIVSPGNFNMFQALRLTNYTQMVLVLSNISGTSQSQEYLLPLQQMVYEFNNTSSVPQVDTLSIGGGISTPPTVLVEWSTEPIVDFTGTYPTIIGAPSAVPYSYVSFIPTNSLITVPYGTSIASNPFRSEITVINHSATPVRWSTVFPTGGHWAPYPPILTSSGRTLHSTTAIYLEAVGAPTDLVIEVIEESWGPKSVATPVGII